MSQFKCLDPRYTHGTTLGSLLHLMNSKLVDSSSETSGANMQLKWQDLREKTATVTNLEFSHRVSGSSGIKDSALGERDDIKQLEGAVYAMDHQLIGMGPYWNLPNSHDCGGPETDAFSQLRKGIDDHETPCNRSEMSKWSKQNKFEALARALSREHK